MKKTFLEKLELRKQKLINQLLETNNDYARSAYQFKLSEIEGYILEEKRRATI